MAGSQSTMSQTAEVDLSHNVVLPVWDWADNYGHLVLDESLLELSGTVRVHQNPGLISLSCPYLVLPNRD